MNKIHPFLCFLKERNVYKAIEKKKNNLGKNCLKRYFFVFTIKMLYDIIKLEIMIQWRSWVNEPNIRL
jgi:hypothetical protein